MKQLAIYILAAGLAGVGAGCNNQPSASRPASATPPTVTGQAAGVSAKPVSRRGGEAVTSVKSERTVRRHRSESQTITNHEADVGQQNNAPADESNNSNATDLSAEQRQAREGHATGDDTLNLPKSSEKLVCSNGKHDHPPFLREDLAYSVTGVDCYGDAATKYGGSYTHANREIASAGECKDEKHGHPPFLREDIAYGVTGKDCFGDPPSMGGSSSAPSPSDEEVQPWK